ncbi:MAG TPA: DUF4389 domain-containing protein [Tepidiformaceae bacterium]|nr:DUF4389 domain-containing protein [Tepidiformaceae bacterium]
MTVSTGDQAYERPAYPVVIEVEPDRGDRNRLTVAFRLILAIPHAILVGGPPIVLGAGIGSLNDNGWFIGGWEGGVIGAVAGVCAIIAWFAILFANQHPRGLWDLAHFYMRWRARALPYMMLLRDEYPPFGDGDYAARFAVDFPEAARNKWSVGLRVFYLIPHIVLLFFLWIAWFVTAVIAWFAILFTGRYPESMIDFAVGVLRWSLRVEAYGLLMRDEYPPFSLGA